MEKDVTNVIFYVRISQIQRPEDYATGASTKGVLYVILPPVPLSQVAFAFTISHGVGYLELLILVKAMREPSRGIGET